MPGSSGSGSRRHTLRGERRKRKGYGYTTQNQRKTPWKEVETPQKIGEPSPYSHCQLGRMVFPDLKNGAWETIRLPFRKANFAGGEPLRLREGAGNQPLFTMFFSWVQVWLSMVMCMNNNNNNNNNNKKKKKKKKNLYRFFHVKKWPNTSPSGRWTQDGQFLGHYCTRRLDQINQCRF